MSSQSSIQEIISIIKDAHDEYYYIIGCDTISKKIYEEIKTILEFEEKHNIKVKYETIAKNIAEAYVSGKYDYYNDYYGKEYPKAEDNVNAFKICESYVLFSANKNLSDENKLFVRERSGIFCIAYHKNNEINHIITYRNILYALDSSFYEYIMS
jgi:hypothetical protein